MPAQSMRGFSATLPVAVSVIAYGSVLGMLAAQKDLSWQELLFMNLSVFAGAAQFVMVDMWGDVLPLVEMTLAVFIINFRYLLIGASLEPLFRSSSLAGKLRMIHLVADENWALTMAASRKDPEGIGTAYLMGSGVCLFLAWNLGTLAGLLGGAAIARPERFALDFAFTAVFTALAVSLWRGYRDILPWTAAACLALLSEHYLPGKWYIVIGGLGGALTAMFIPSPPKGEADHA